MRGGQALPIARLEGRAGHRPQGKGHAPHLDLRPHLRPHPLALASHHTLTLNALTLPSHQPLTLGDGLACVDAPAYEEGPHGV